MMTPEQLSQLRILIEERIVELEESIPRLEERVAPVAPDVAIGRLSRTDSMMNAGTVGLALKDARERLTRLRNRLKRIDDESFSLCGLCGKEIGLDRLLAVPDRGVCKACLQSVSRR